jgi:two-component system LytT family sensor kinase
LTQGFNKYFRLIPLPILLFGFGMLSLPISSGYDGSWTFVGIDTFINVVLMVSASVLLEWRIYKYPTTVLAQTHATLLAFIIAVSLFVFSEYVLSTLLFKDPAYLYHIAHTKAMRFIISWLGLGWVAHITVLRKHQDDYLKDIQLHQHTITNLKEAELFKLRQQLQPHFLYNSLNSINALVHIDPEKTQEMVGRLSDFLRLSVKRDVEEKISIIDELDYIESYLSIESVRFGNRLHIDIEKDGLGWEKAKIPAFILQPVLENAIKFGVYGNIHIVLKDHILFITITNPYDESLQTPRGTGFGLEGIARRLLILYARADLLETKKDQQLFTTLIKIPQ